MHIYNHIKLLPNSILIGYILGYKHFFSVDKFFRGIRNNI